MTEGRPGFDYSFLASAVDSVGNPFQRARLAFLAYNRVAIPLGLRRGNTVLDVGCCLGTTGHYLSRIGVKSVGVDINLEAVRSGGAIWGDKKRSKRFVADGGRLPFVNNCFTAVISQDMLEHIHNDEALVLVFREMVRVLRGDKMFHKVTTLEDKLNINADPTHYLKWSEERWERWFLRMGWETIGSPTKHFPSRGISYGNFLLVRSF